MAESLLQICRIIRSKDWMTSIDLTDAFLHVLINKASQRLLQFDWAGRRYQFRVLPFGPPLSPLVFTKILRPVLRWARSKGIRISAYLDDLVILASSKALAKEHTSIVTNMLQRLGFLINDSKSALRPTQILKHLGFYINMRKMILTLPKGPMDVDNYHDSTSSFIHRQSSRSHASSPSSTPSDTTLGGMQGQRSCFCSRLVQQLSKEALNDISWWRDHLQSWTGQSFLPQIPEEDLFTDASDWGWELYSPTR